jgi:energy-coupling factor transporter ATP-binding protein EcfA2
VIGTQRTHVAVQALSIAAASAAGFEMDLYSSTPHEFDSRTRTIKESDYTRRLRPAVAAAYAFRTTCIKYGVDVELMHSLLAAGGWTLTADVIPVAPGPVPPLRDCAVAADDRRSPVLLAAIALRAGFPGDAATAPLHVAASAALTRSMLAATRFPCVAVVGGAAAVETPILAAPEVLHPAFVALVTEAANRCASSAPDLAVASCAASPVVPPPAPAELDAHGVLTTPPTAAAKVWWLVEAAADGTPCAIWEQDAAAALLDAWRQEAVDRRKFPAGTEALLAYLRRRANAAFGRDVGPRPAATVVPPLSPTTPETPDREGAEAAAAAQQQQLQQPLATALLTLVAGAVRTAARAAATTWLARQPRVVVDDDGDAAALAQRRCCASDAVMTIGPPGSGKSTLMRAFAAALKAATEAPTADVAGAPKPAALSAEWLNQDECGKREFFLAALRQASASRSVSHVIIDKSNLTDQARDDYRDLLHVTAVVLFAHPGGPEALYRTCVDRIAGRGEHHRTLRASGGMDKNATIVRNFVASYRGLEDLEGDARVLVLDVTQPIGALLRRLWKHLSAVGSVALPPLSETAIALAVLQSHAYEASLR